MVFHVKLKQNFDEQNFNQQHFFFWKKNGKDSSRKNISDEIVCWFMTHLLDNRHVWTDDTTMENEIFVTSDMSRQTVGLGNGAPLCSIFQNS